MEMPETSHVPLPHRASRNDLAPLVRVHLPDAGRRRNKLASLFGVACSSILFLVSFSQGDAATASAAAVAGLRPQAATTASVRPRDYVVRLYYGNRDRLAELVNRYDVFEYANHEEGYVMARLRAPEFQELLTAGYRLELDEAQTADANRVLENALDQNAGIPSYPCYRTVEETYEALGQLASRHPGLATLVDIGDSWEKATPGGPPGYDLLVLVLSNQARPGPKPRFFLMAEHHARELTTAETALRFAEELATRYGSDPDVTWLLDYYEVHVLPMANPDGRKWAEQGEFWRKNTNPGNGCTDFPYFGTDLNRNCGYSWGGTGSSDDACQEIYRGPVEFSEPENQAIRAYVRSLFPDQRGPGASAPAPLDATGLFISLHSFARLVLYPWGSTDSPAPNQAGLQTLGAKFGFFNRYTVQASNRLYPTSGTADEWVYGELGVASYTFEMGTAFFEACANFENVIYPSNRLALHYAAKTCRQPYRDPAGPDVLQLAASPVTNLSGATLTLTALAEAGRFFGTDPALPGRPIAAARVSVDEPSWIEGVVTQPMVASDGLFNTSKESIQAVIDTTGWAPGRHTLFVEAQDVSGNWGVPTAVFAWIEPLHLQARVSPEGIVLAWPGVDGKRYSVLHAPDLHSPFVVLASGVPAVLPTTTYTDAANRDAARFYSVWMEP